MEATPLPLISSFIIRFVVDEAPAQPIYHGVIRHIQTSKELIFTEWREATDFMYRFVQIDELQPPSSPETSITDP